MTYNLIHDNCLNVIGKLKIEHNNLVIVTDPPFNINYKYNTYTDNLIESEYLKMIYNVTLELPFVMINYPEMLYKVSNFIDKIPTRVISWVYNSNTARQHRDIAFFGVTPNFNQIRQPYKNLTDKRIKKRIEDGKEGAKLYDWWNINQVKNVSKEKTSHPCQMPLEVMTNIIGILPKGMTIIDPFMGSGTTGIACQKMGYDFIGIEIDESYFKIAEERMKNETHNYDS